MPTGEYIVGSGLSITSASWGTALDLNLYEDKDFRDIVNRLTEIEKRLAILHPNEELQSRFPALQEAYDNYKLIERLVNDKKD